MDFKLPPDLVDYLAELDRFIATDIKPLEEADDNIRFFDHRREWARTDFDRGGLPSREWEALLREARRRADAAGHLRFTLPKKYGGKEGSQLWMAVIREYFAAMGLGLHNDLQNEHSIVGNFPYVAMLMEHGTEAQQDDLIPGMCDGSRRICFGLTEPNHGSDATWMESYAKTETRDGIPGWVINGAKMWTTGIHVGSHLAAFARTSGTRGSAKGITCFLVPIPSPGLEIGEYLWTFNMPTDHPYVYLRDCWVPASAILGQADNGLSLAQSFVNQNRLRQAAASLGAASYCIEESVKYARRRQPFGKSLSDNQAIQFPLVELGTQAEMLRLLIYSTGAQMDNMCLDEVERTLSDKVSMCNYWANRLCCDAADRAMQVHGAIGYSRHKPFEHIYRHHRRYRITEGSEEIQMRKIAAFMFGYRGPRKSQVDEWMQGD